MTATIDNKNKSTLVQIMNELDGFSQEELNYVLYWVKVKKATALAKQIDDSIRPNNLTLEDIYAERDAVRKETNQ